MTGNVPEHVPAPIPADEILQKVAIARETQGALAHDFRDPEEFPGVLAWLADQGIYTTSEPEDPGSIWEFWSKPSRARRATAKQIGNLMLNATGALEAAENPEITEALTENRLGTLLQGLLQKTDLLRVDGLHVAEVKRNKQGIPFEGTVTAESITFGVETVEEQALLSTLFQTLCRKNVPSRTSQPKRKKRKQQEGSNKLHIVTPGIDQESGRPTVSVNYMSEYTVRVIEEVMIRATGAEEEARWGTRLPEQRMSLSDWKNGTEIGGQPFHPVTIHPEPKKRMEAVNRHYNNWRDRMPAVTFRWQEGIVASPPELQLARRSESLGSSVSGAFEQVRKIFNSLSRPLRGSGQFNQPQHPDKNQRLAIEENVDLKRDPIGSGQPGPAVPRALTLSERTGQKTRTMLKEQKARPAEAVGKALATLWGIGAEAVFELGGKVLPQLKNKGMDVAKELRNRREQKEAAKKSGEKLDRAIREARGLPPAV